MFVTFGILTASKLDETHQIIDSIEANNIPDHSYEIIVVGNVDLDRKNTKVFKDDSCEASNWITKKKNMVIDNSSAKDNDLVIIAKDYIKYHKDWYSGLLKFAASYPFDILMNSICNSAGKRYLDWIWDNPVVGAGRNIDYSITGHPKQFVPGNFTAAKMKVFKQFRFAERMVGLGKQSDVDWSRRALSSFSYNFNPFSLCEAFGKCSKRYPKFRRPCECNYCVSRSTH